MVCERGPGMSSGRVKVFREFGKGQSSKSERIKTHTLARIDILPVAAAAVCEISILNHSNNQYSALAAAIKP